MGEIIALRPEFVPTEIHARPVRVKGVWYMWLGPEQGRRPTGHPPVKRGPRGKALLEIGQVWVELHTMMLWEVCSFEIARAHPCYPHDVEIRHYRGTWREWPAEMTLRHKMRVWEEAEEFNCDLREKADLAARFDVTSPWRGTELAVESAQSFFGRDPYGNKLELVQARSPKPPGGPPRKGSVWRYRNGRSLLTVTRLRRDKGEKLWLSVSFPSGGFGVMEYDAWNWHSRYVKVS